MDMKEIKDDLLVKATIGKGMSFSVIRSLLSNENVIVIDPKAEMKEMKKVFEGTEIRKAEAQVTPFDLELK